jgi:hypothetical protein
LAQAQAGVAGGWMNMMHYIDAREDSVASGPWRKTEDGLHRGWQATQSLIMVPYELPLEYDLEISFTCKTRSEEIAFTIAHGGQSVSCLLGARNNTRSGLCRVRGLEIWRHNVGKDLPIEAERKHFIQIQSRRTGLKIILNQELLLHYRSSVRELTASKRWSLPNPKAFGFGAMRDDVTFHSVWLREVSGQGQFITQRGLPR